MTTNQVIERLDFFTKKNAVGSFSPEEKMLAINVAQNGLYNWYVGLPELYSADNPPSVHYDKTQRIADALLPFRETVNINLTNGIGTFPSDYAYLDATSVRYYLNQNDCENSDRPGVLDYRAIDVVTDKEWADRVSSTIDYPTMQWPVLRTISKTTLEVSPRTIKRIEFIYLRNPKPFYWGHTYVNRRPVYDPADPLNQELEWFDMDQNRVVMRALSYLGINVKDNEIVQFAELKQKEGV